MNEEQNVVTTPTSTENNSGGTSTKQAEQPKVKSSEVLRVLSEEYKLNLFTDEGVSAFREHIAQTRVEANTYKTKYEETEKQVKQYQDKEKDYQVRLEALGMGFQSGQLEEVIALAKVNMKDNQTLTDGLKVVKEKYGSVFSAPKQVGTQFNDLPGDKPNIPKTDQDKYLSQNARVAAWNKKQEKLKK
jgi:hypothetical protein